MVWICIEKIVYFDFDTKICVASLLRVSAVRDQGVPGVENFLFLRAWGWGIDRQETKKWQIPGVMPGGEGGDGNRWN